MFFIILKPILYCFISVVCYDQVSGILAAEWMQFAQSGTREETDEDMILSLGS